MKKTALVIMAAGIGSRYGAGIKQLAKLGPHGEIIIDYSIHDALKAGFNKIIFVIRKDIEKDFREVIGDRISAVADVEYAFQELTDLPDGFSVPEGRKKPWGTAHAILAARDLIDCPFAVINADDYYGPEGFKKVHDYLANEACDSEDCLDLCMAGFVLGNTLSENGAVTRGVCHVDDSGRLIEVTETFGICRENGRVTGRTEQGEPVDLSEDDVVSMNMWGLSPAVIDIFKNGFRGFLAGLADGDVKSEFLLPAEIDKLIKSKRASVRVLNSSDRWYGITYQEDRPYVEKALAGLTEKGIYGDKLFG